MSHPKKALAVFLLATLSLTGCMKLDTTISFMKGQATFAVALHVSEDFLKLDDGTTEATKGKAIKDLSSEERQKLCAILGEESPEGFSQKDDVKVTVSEKGLDEKGRMICEIKSDPQPITKGELPYEVTYDAKKGTYRVAGNTSSFLGNDESMDPAQLKAMGVEMTMTFLFPGALTHYEFNGAQELPAGVSKVGETGITMDLLTVKAASFTLEGSEEAPFLLSGETLAIFLLSFFGGLAVVAFGVAWFVAPNPAREKVKSFSKR